jgi:predicted O-methyltransferase YrrM
VGDSAAALYVEEFASEDEVLRSVRARSQEAGIPAIPPSTGAALRWFASLLRARHVAEVGSGGGYSGLWLLAGMDPRGALTTIEIDPDRHALAQRAFAAAKVGDRVRMMLGPALSVLPKLADGNYDLVFLDAVKSEYPAYLEHAKRLLRAEGLLLADNVLWGGRVADESSSDEDTRGLRAFNDAVLADPDLHAVILPVGDGLMAAYLRPKGGGRSR